MAIYGIPDDELATFQREAYESEGKTWCESCTSYQPNEDFNSDGVCLSCVTSSIDRLTDAEAF